MENIHPIFDRLLQRTDRETRLGQTAKVLWLTGLSGSGKSTIAQALERRLYNEGFFAQVLDGDNIRSGINNNLGFSEEDLKEAVRAAPASIKAVAFNLAHDFRNENYVIHPERIERTIPIFEALIEEDVTHKHHRNHGELAYVFKDKLPPDWKRAEAELTKAIEIRTKRNESGFRLYEFNRAICRIHLQFPFHEIKSDLDEALPWPRTGDLIRQPEQVHGGVLLKWMQENSAQLGGWFEENKIKF